LKKKCSEIAQTAAVTPQFTKNYFSEKPRGVKANGWSDAVGKKNALLQPFLIIYC
jgi:hypothetical protein